MLKTLKLQNYRKHLDRTISFSQGINAIRADNEAGKTSILEAIAYALFGSGALKESLEDVVTYGTPVSKLRVELEFEFLGVTYNVYRAKSGAELTFGNERVTGQKEVTKFIEALLGTSGDMAGRLMIAEQTELRGALSEGPTAAGKMIEYLANFDLLDRVIGLVQTKLPSGDTARVLERVEGLRLRLAEPGDVADLPALQAAVDEATLQQVNAEDARDCFSADLKAVDVDGAKASLAREAALSAAIAQRETQITTLEAACAAALPVEPAVEEFTAARDGIERTKNAKAAFAVHDALKAASIEPAWDKDLASLDAELVSARAAAVQAGVEVETRRTAATEASAAREAGKNTRRTAAVKLESDANLEITRLEGRLIKEESCAFCGKDLKDIPEVAQINNPLTAQIAQARAALATGIAAAEAEMAAFLQSSGDLVNVSAANLVGAQTLQTEAKGYVQDLEGVLAENARVEALYERAGDNIVVDRSTVPGTWSWVGAEAHVTYHSDYAAILAELEAQQRRAVAAAATREQQKLQLTQLQAADCQARAEQAAIDTKAAEAVLARAAKLQDDLSVAAQAVAGLRTVTGAAEAALATAVALQEQAAKQRAQALADLAKAEAELVELGENNALIKKVRAARPQITNELWSIVLSGVSHYFSAVRGEPSSITRGDGGFRVNGNPVAGLSGSAKDMLGLAIRIALTKTFLPNIPFMSLDEPGSACSEQRETSMLGLLSTIGFGQIILVTHSDLADAVSDNIITL